MKILNTQQIKQADKATLKKEAIDSIDLMERAALSCFRWLEEEIIDDTKKIHVFCGVGNNGGDGLAIARFLYEDDFEIEAYVVHFSKKMTDDFVINYQRAEDVGLHPESIHSIDDFPIINKEDVVVDAIFGIGLSRSPQDFTKTLITHINTSKAVIYAIDVPSGLFIDQPTTHIDSVVLAKETLTFQTPKLSFLLPDSQRFTADFSILDIGLDENFLANQKTNYSFTLDEDIASFIKVRKKFAHKGNFGHSLLIGGSFGKIGAAVLASKAAIRVGSGLVTAYIPKCGYTIMQTTIPEVMVEVDAENEINYFNFKTTPTVIGVGMGMGHSEKTTHAFANFLQKNTIPLVLDADALNILSKDKKLLKLLPKDSILTPHPKELERLIGTWDNDFKKLDKLKEFSTKYQCIVVLKGSHTVVVQNEKFYFNSTGNPALATAGTGDVLAGIITGLRAQSYTPLEAAILGVFMHGRAADLYAIEKSQESFIASDFFTFLPEVYNSIQYLNHLSEDSFEEGYDGFDDDFFDEDIDIPF